MGDNQIYGDDAVKIYLAEVVKVPRLTRSQELVSIQQAQGGDQEAESARRRLVETHLHLVVALAEQYRQHDVHMLDLIQAGNLGLIHALQTLSELDPASFAELATPHIESAIKRAIASRE